MLRLATDDDLFGFIDALVPEWWNNGLYEAFFKLYEHTKIVRDIAQLDERGTFEYLADKEKILTMKKTLDSTKEIIEKWGDDYGT